MEWVLLALNIVFVNLWAFAEIRAGNWKADALCRDNAERDRDILRTKIANAKKALE